MATQAPTAKKDHDSSWSCLPLKAFKGRPWFKPGAKPHRQSPSIPKSTEVKQSSETLSSDDNTSTNMPQPVSEEAVAGSQELASRILAIINRYKLPTRTDSPPGSADTFLSQICDQIARSQPIQMCLPAFPFKSPNTSTKVLGYLPDKAEEFALAHLNGLCAAIARIYEPGATLMIISDGLVYNDLLGVPDKNVWAYGETLRAIALEQNLKHIQFSRLKDLAKIDVPDKVDQITYISNATNFRHTLLNQYSDPKFDATSRIHDDENTCLTYRGYLKFLFTDLVDVYPVGPSRSKNEYKRGTEYIAKQMLFRGDAFARAVRETFPSYIRLSIHPSSSSTESKISISLLPTDTSFTTPWHCCIAFHLDGTSTTGHHSQFDSDARYELIHKNGRPSFYLEKSPLLSGWGPVACDPLYPAGLMLRPAAGPNTLSIEAIHGEKVRSLAQRNSPIILRDFTQTRNRDLFIATSHRLGTPTGWKFGLVLEVKDQGANTRGLNNVLSSEWMPFHYDGLFKTSPRPGSTELISTPPNFQLFTSVTTSPKNTGFTLFSTSTKVFQHLAEQGLSIETLRNLKWSVSTSSFDATALRGLPLVVDHPATGQPCLRFHEPWPQAKTKFDATEIEIENASCVGEGWDSGRICEVLTELLHDRRVCYYHAWEKGDLLVSDNVLAHHTRSDFVGGSERELWRINFD